MTSLKSGGRDGGWDLKITFGGASECIIARHIIDQPAHEGTHISRRNLAARMRDIVVPVSEAPSDLERIPSENLISDGCINTSAT